MSREILFKGKRTDNGKWVEGDLIHRTWSGGERCSYIFNANYNHGFIGDAKVDPSTVCQYTGLTDKNGNRIFENDIVHKYIRGDEAKFTTGTIKYGVYNSPLGEYQRTHIGFYIYWNTESQRADYRCDFAYWANVLEVSGNVFDNPELLKGGTDEND